VLVEKATELGVARIVPVRMQHSSVRQANEERLRQIAIEAAEQCGRDTVPEIAPLQDFTSLLGQWPAARPLLMADEAGIGSPPAALLPNLRPPLAVLIGPEGGFSLGEQALLRGQPSVQGMTLGPRILRAETAGIAALSVVLAWCGDWHEKPRFTLTQE
jgi:16S rRNA (uracil1498-N3)-methyltransferase